MFRLARHVLTGPDEDLQLIFSRFGTILSCEVIRDKRTGDSLQYAFIEFENQKDCEQAYFKMQGVLIDDHRIHVDFSQSVGVTYLRVYVSAFLFLTTRDRCRNCRIAGGMPPSPNGEANGEGLVEWRILKGSGSIEHQRIHAERKKTDTGWCSTEAR